VVHIVTTVPYSVKDILKHWRRQYISLYRTGGWGSLHLNVRYSTYDTQIIFSSFVPFHVGYLQFGEEYKLWSSLWCNFLQLSFTSTFMDQNNLLRTLFFSHALNVYYIWGFSDDGDKRM